jgi:proteasome alpha subunit
MKDRADYARKGISRGRSLAVLAYADGILFVSENPSRALHKISEMYDRIAFAAVGRYNEFESLRVAGVRLADTRGYLYDRRDVTGRGLANAYAQTLGTIFTDQGISKPYEVELVVAEVGDTSDADQIYRLTYDGQVIDEHGLVVMGGSAEAVKSQLERAYEANMPLSDALRAAVDALSADTVDGRRLAASQLEVAVLDRGRARQRKFRRLVGAPLARLLENGAAPENGDDDNGDDDGSDGNSGSGAKGGDAGATAAPSVSGGAATDDVLGEVDDLLDDEHDDQENGGSTS